MAKPETFSFSINEQGETSGEMFAWSFTAKRFLSIRDRITKDGIVRGLVGEASPLTAHPDTLMRVEMLAHLQVSLVESPKAWRDSGNGLDLYDDNVLIKMYETVVKEQNTAIEKVIENGEEAKTKLRAKARKEKPETQKDESHGAS